MKNNCVLSHNLLVITSMGFKHGAHTAYNINYHFVFCPKRRKSVLVDLIATECSELLKAEASKNGLEIIALEVMPDHVHIFLSAPPKISPASIVSKLKGTTSATLRSRYPQLKRLPTLWSSSYYVGTVGSVSDSVVKLYIENQKGH